MKILLVAVFLGPLAVVSTLLSKSLDQDFVEYSADLVKKINSMNTTWKAGPNFAGETAESVLKRLGTPRLSLEKVPKLPVIERERADGDIPEEFDARVQWPNCTSIGRIYAQGNCQASWAFSAVGAMTDRYCITHGGQQFNFSVEDSVACSLSPFFSNNCFGGSTTIAWLYWLDTGLVSGGGYNSSSGCRPYAYPPCDHYEKGSHGSCSDPLPDEPFCNKTCRRGYPKSYENDKKKGLRIYRVGHHEADIQNEIMNHGPVSGDMDLYADFLLYRSGVYQDKGSAFIAAHSVKVLGWGVENGQKYWLCANSWNSEWGDKGFFKILRGTNECNLEFNLHAGQPY
ncbi:cathepsin B-like cysteine proteinase 3 [Acanthaster planci]|uniref:Cathepsin B-like cysteine proteinase 3 n=1 Tax=Acanthaster planci TaxID=133434 RepID=A0A8B7ZEJ9_ACAPL|nr:cathepsin B-like cysteine proteinase 3 [Acanthaster planci]XP_022103422.1 cathepsin B-like cysteine proteinase 3 [Acanthaster planci]